LADHYFSASDISSIKNGNMVVNYLKEHQGDERVYFVDSQGIYNQWIASDGPFNNLNLFNIWQMPRMSADYKAYLGSVGRNQMRLWEQASIQYIAAPAQILKQLQANPMVGKLFEPVLNYQIPTAQGMRTDVLLKFKGALPRMALYSGWKVVPLEEQCNELATRNHNARKTLLVSEDSGLKSQIAVADFQSLETKITKRKAMAKVNSSEPAIVRFSQYNQSGWSVLVDGELAKLLQVDYLCMGVYVPAGEHTVEFRCPDDSGRLIWILVVLGVSLGGAGLLIVSRKGATV
jgi:hypothetical protein